MIMRWVEVIRLRSEPAGESPAAEWLTDAVQELAGKKHLLSATVYSRIDISSDIGIQLEWDTPPASATGSDVGLGIAHALRPFGLLDHTVWVERQSMTASKQGPVLRKTSGSEKLPGR
jgi:hypothetical protein